MSELDDELKEVKIHQIMTKDMIAACPTNKFSQAFQFLVNEMSITCLFAKMESY